MRFSGSMRDVARPYGQTRLLKTLDALSQLAQVALLRRHETSDAHESISGRCFWESEYGPYAGHWSWVWPRRVIDTLFWMDRDGDKGHCELSDERDYHRALHKVRRFEGR